VAAWLQIQHLAGLGMDALKLQWEQLAFGKDLGLLDFWDKSISPLVAGFNQLISTSYFCCEAIARGELIMKKFSRLLWKRRKTGRGSM
jgi:hypothetical protein